MLPFYLTLHSSSSPDLLSCVSSSVVPHVCPPTVVDKKPSSQDPVETTQQFTCHLKLTMHDINEKSEIVFIYVVYIINYMYVTFLERFVFNYP